MRNKIQEADFSAYVRNSLDEQIAAVMDAARDAGKATVAGQNKGDKVARFVMAHLAVQGIALKAEISEDGTVQDVILGKSEEVVANAVKEAKAAYTSGIRKASNAATLKALRERDGLLHANAVTRNLSATLATVDARCSEVGRMLRAVVRGLDAKLLVWAWANSEDVRRDKVISAIAAEEQTDAVKLEKAHKAFSKALDNLATLAGWDAVADAVASAELARKGTAVAQEA